MSKDQTLPEDFASRYRRAFREHGCPPSDDALAITRSLRVEGDLNARRLAEQIEKACRAA